MTQIAIRFVTSGGTSAGIQSLALSEAARLPGLFAKGMAFSQKEHTPLPPITSPPSRQPKMELITVSPSKRLRKLWIKRVSRLQRLEGKKLKTLQRSLPAYYVATALAADHHIPFDSLFIGGALTTLALETLKQGSMKPGVDAMQSENTKRSGLGPVIEAEIMDAAETKVFWETISDAPPLPPSQPIDVSEARKRLHARKANVEESMTLFRERYQPPPKH